MRGESAVVVQLVLHSSYVRSHTLSQAVSRGLILWDEVQPTQAWIDSNIPEVRKRLRGYPVMLIHFSFNLPLCVCVWSQIVQKHAFLSGKSGGGKPDPFLDHQTFRWPTRYI